MKERGVSPVIGFIIVMFAFISLGGFILASMGRQAESRVYGLTDVMRQAEKRQEQHLTFVHAYENSVENELRAHFYNYGTRKITMVRLWVNGNEVSAADVSFQVGGYPTGDNVFDVRELTEVVIDNISYYAGVDNCFLVFLTESEALYSCLIPRR